MHNVSRRKFFKNTTIGTAGLMVGAHIFKPEMVFANSPETIEYGIGGLVPLSVIENVNLLLQRTGKFTGEQLVALTSDLHTRPAAPGNKGRMAVVLPVNDKRLLTLIKSLKENITDKNRAQKISIAFGWICNNETYKYLQPVYGEKPTSEKIREVQLYQDAALIEALTTKPALNGIEAEDLSRFFLEILPRAITRVHTLKPATDGAEWVNRVSEWRRHNNRYMEQLAKSFLNPDKKAKEQYVTIPKFYDKHDQIISCSRSLQLAENASAEAIESALERTEEYSLYGKILSNSANKILMVNDYLTNNESYETVEKQLI